MLSLLLILVVLAVSLTVVLWAGTFFFQGYIYTEPSPGIFWQAPAAAGLLTLGYAIWVYWIALSATATPTNIPVDTIFRFNPADDMFDRPASPIWAIKSDRKKTGDNKDGAVTQYVSKPDERGKFHYRTISIKPHPWHGQDIIAIEIENPDKTKMRFDLAQTAASDYRQFVSRDGWVIREYEEGPTGIPIKFRFGRLLLNLFFNIAHFAGWFIALWVILRFQWMHALGFAAVLWLIGTMILLPMILGQAGAVAKSRTPTRTGLVSPTRERGMWQLT